MLKEEAGGEDDSTYPAYPARSQLRSRISTGLNWPCNINSFAALLDLDVPRSSGGRLVEPSHKLFCHLPPGGLFVPRLRSVIAPPAPNHHTIRMLIDRIQLQLPILRIERAKAEHPIGFMVLRPEKRINRFPFRFAFGLGDLSNCVRHPALSIGIKGVDRGKQRVDSVAHTFQPVVIPLPRL